MSFGYVFFACLERKRTTAEWETGGHKQRPGPMEIVARKNSRSLAKRQQKNVHSTKHGHPSWYVSVYMFLSWTKVSAPVSVFNSKLVSNNQSVELVAMPFWSWFFIQNLASIGLQWPAPNWPRSVRPRHHQAVIENVPGIDRIFPAVMMHPTVDFEFGASAAFPLKTWGIFWSTSNLVIHSFGYSKTK